MAKIIDISMEIKEGMIFYPGDPEIKIKKYLSIPKDPVNLSTLNFGSHTGTHIDSGLHIKKKGRSTSKLPLNSFYGKCKVLDLTKAGKEIKKQHLEKYNLEKDDIVLLKTQNSKKQYNKFRKDFTHISEEAAEYLAEKKIKTIGVDYLSVSKFNTKNKVHEILIKNMTVFEGLNLSKVKQGEYIFAGLPLKINCDGAPARVILIKN